VSVRRLRPLPIAAASLERRYGLMAETVLFQTNDPALLAAADASFGRFPLPADGRDPLVIRLFTEEAPGRPGRPGRPGGPAAFGRPAATSGPRTGATAGPRTGAGGIVHRTQGDLFLISGPEDVAAVELDAGLAVGWVSSETANNSGHVRYAFIEAMGLSLLTTPARGYFSIHAAGVARGGAGIALHGPAGAGKSTLAIACARRGMDVFAEDAVFVRAAPAGIEFWGLPWVHRVMPDAPRFFPELADLRSRRQPNGELKLEVDLDVVYPGRAVPGARPGPVVILERGSPGATRIERLDERDAADAIEVIWPYEVAWTEQLEHGVRQLIAAGVHRLHVNGTPDEAVDALDELLDGLAPPIATA
jgi:hypothetical protein